MNPRAPLTEAAYACFGDDPEAMRNQMEQVEIMLVELQEGAQAVKDKPCGENFRKLYELLP